MRRLITYPLAFLAGWLFNFVVDIQFFSGFAAGWLMNSKLGPVIESLVDYFQ